MVFCIAVEVDEDSTSDLGLGQLSRQRRIIDANCFQWLTELYKTRTRDSGRNWSWCYMI